MWKARVFYAARVVARAPPVVCALWQACPQLRALLTQDLSTLHRLCPKTCLLYTSPSPRD
eukprot:9041666-Alexandrium_andersonii.AAC.1